MERGGLSPNDGVDKELIQILLDTVELRNDQQSIESKHRYEMEKIERREAIRREENTYRCMVVEGYDEESRTVHVVNHEYNHPDTSYVINVPDFPEQEEYLKDLENGDTLQIEVDYSVQGSRYIREIS